MIHGAAGFTGVPQRLSNKWNDNHEDSCFTSGLPG